jgi:hypothetical protein
VVIESPRHARIAGETITCHPMPPRHHRKPWMDER